MCCVSAAIRKNVKDHLYEVESVGSVILLRFFRKYLVAK